MFETGPDSVDAIVRVIQSSLAPIFLLTAIASLLSVFNTRLARIADQVQALSAAAAASAAETGDAARLAADRLARARRLDHLRQRSHMLDVAVIAGALGGACTCGTVLALYLGFLRSRATVSLLFFLFGIAIFCTIAALAAFLTEVLWASRGVRADVERHINEQDL